MELKEEIVRLLQEEMTESKGIKEVYFQRLTVYPREAPVTGGTYEP